MALQSDHMPSGKVMRAMSHWGVSSLLTAAHVSPRYSVQGPWQMDTATPFHRRDDGSPQSLESPRSHNCPATEAGVRHGLSDIEAGTLTGHCSVSLCLHHASDSSTQHHRPSTGTLQGRLLCLSELISLRASGREDTGQQATATFRKETRTGRAPGTCL